MNDNTQFKTPEFVPAPIPENDKARIEALLAYKILDTPETETFDDITRMASVLCNTPIATITMVDKFRQWFKSYIGLSERENSREYSFCAHAIASAEDIFIIDDATQHEKFAGNPLVTGEPKIVFYAGVPLIDRNGFALGTLCVIDKQTKELTTEQQDGLKVLARQVMEKLEFRRSLLELTASKNILEETKERYELALEAGKLGSYDADLETGLMSCTEQCKKNYGLSKDDTFNLPALFDCILPEHRATVSKKIEEAAANDTTYQVEYAVRWPDQSIHWVSVQGKMFKNNQTNAKRMVGVTIDITERKLEEEQKNSFLSIASHELKTPATSLKVALELLNQMKHEPSSPMQVNLIEQANKSMDRMSVLINNLLDAKQIADTHLALHKSYFTMGEVVFSACNHIVVAGKQKLIIEGDTYARVFADESRIEQVLVNFVNNSLKYAPQEKQITINISLQENECVVSVRDTGPGISNTEIPFLFNRYFRSNTARPSKNGLGLGLYISAEIIQRHGGKIGVDSKEGLGSSFWFSIPLQGEN